MHADIIQTAVFIVKILISDSVIKYLFFFQDKLGKKINCPCGTFTLQLTFYQSYNHIRPACAKLRQTGLPVPSYGRQACLCRIRQTGADRQSAVFSQIPQFREFLGRLSPGPSGVGKLGKTAAS